MSKRYKQTSDLVENREYSLDEAVSTIKKFSPPKFDASVCLSFHMGVDSKKSDQMIRNNVCLPNGTGKNIRVLAFAQGNLVKVAKDAGADYVGLDDLIAKIQDGFLDFDAVVAETSVMSEVRKVAKILGPRNLMPTPKAGSVTNDIALAVKEIKAGRIDYKIDKNGNISGLIGKLSFEPKALIENAKAFIDSVLSSRPASAKGAYIRSLTITPSMCCGIKLASSIYN